MLNLMMEDEKLILMLEDDLDHSKANNLLCEIKEILQTRTEYKEVILDINNSLLKDFIAISFIIGLCDLSKKNRRRFEIVGINKEMKQLFKTLNISWVIGS